MRTCLVAAACFVLASVSLPALACSLAYRDGELSVVQDPGLFSEHYERFGAAVWDWGVTIPANTPAILWRVGEDSFIPPGSVPDAGFIALSRYDDGVTTPFSHWNGALPEGVDLGRSSTYVIVPDGGFVDNGMYQIADMTMLQGKNGYPGGKGASGIFITGGVLPYPQSLGTLELFPNYLVPDETMADVWWKDIEVGSSSGSCTALIGAAVAGMHLKLTAAFEPWKYAFHYMLFVDGELWDVEDSRPSYLSIPLGLERSVTNVYGFCDAPANLCGCVDWETYELCTVESWRELWADDHAYRGVETGKTHSIFMRAWLPGTDVVLETPPVEVDFTCPERIAVPCSVEGADDGVEAVETVGDVAGPLDVVIPGDAGTDEGTDAGAGGGGGCSAAPDSAAGPMFMLLAWLVAAILVARRRTAGMRSRS